MSLSKLVKLDFYAMKPLVKTMLGFLIVPIILGIIIDPGVSVMITLTFVVFMLNMVFSIAEKSNFHKLYGILPIKKYSYILSRYVFSITILCVTALLTFIMYGVLSFVLDGYISWINGLSYLVASMVISLFFISIQYPFYFRFNYSKATIMSILPYLLCFTIGAPLLNNLMNDAKFYTFIIQIAHYLQAQPGILVLSGLGVSTVMLVISLIFSTHIHKFDC